MNNNIKNLVRDELALLRVHATEEELNKLNALLLFSGRTMENLCVYGQLTGSCNSERAIELLNLCAKPFSCGLTENYKQEFKPFKFEAFHHVRTWFSPLELYITKTRQPMKDANSIVDFLKGKTNFIELYHGVLEVWFDPKSK